MKRLALNPVSARALVWSAAILLLLGAMVMSPAAGFLLGCLAAIAAVGPAVFGHGRPQAAGVALLILALAMAAALYPRFADGQAAWRAKATAR